MNVASRPATPAASEISAGLIDCDIHPLLHKPADIKKYLPARWVEHLELFGSNLRQPFHGADLWPKPSPHISRRDAYPPAGGPPGSDLAFMREQHLDPFNVRLGILQVLVPTGANQRNVNFGAAICSALNDWQQDAWTSREPRLRGSIVVTQDYPEAAVSEIRRCGGKRDFVQVSVAQRTLEPLGRRRYWPVYAEAQAHDLPIGIHSGGYGGHPSVAGGGWSSYYADSHDLIPLCNQAILTSLVMEGVFEEFPKLRVVLIEGGFSWVPALAWRLDSLWLRLRKEVPHVRRPPSEYIREHVWYTTQPMDDIETPQHMQQMFEWVGWDRLLFASDYPHWDNDDVRYAFKFSMSEEQKAQIFRENATRVFNFDR
jgi:uncharacterized protein